MVRKKWLIRAFGVISLYLLVCLAQIYRERGLTPGGNTGQNGLWLGHRWFDDSRFKPVTSAQLAQLAERCRRLQFHDLFLHVGPVDSQGRLPAWRPERWRRTRTALPGVRWQAWIGAPNAAYLGPAGDTFDLSRPEARGRLLDEVQTLLESGFHGVHYDFEPLQDGDGNFLALLEETRRRFPEAWISVATPKLQPPGLWIPRQWGAAYFRQVAERCQQIVLMGYDTMHPNETLYRRFLAHQVYSLRRLLPCALMVGVPCYEDNAPYHNPRAESLAAGIEGARAGGADSLALYCEWTCDEREWEVWRRFWIDAYNLPNTAGSTSSLTTPASSLTNPAQPSGIPSSAR